MCSPHHHLLDDTDQSLLTSVAFYKLILSKSCPLRYQELQVSDRPWGFFFLGFLLRENLLSIHPASFNGQSDDAHVKNSWDQSGVSTAGCSESLLTPV